MSSPQWPGQPPGGAGYPPPPPPGAPLPGGGIPPPPRRGGGGPLVPLLIIGVVAVLALVGIGAFVILASGDDDSDRRSAYPSYSSTSSPYSSEPSPGSTGGTSSDPTTILGPTIRTAKGNTFTRSGTRRASCVSRANARLMTALRTNSCVGDMYTAVYASPTRNIITAVSIAKFSSSSAASSISNVTNSEGWPRLLTPSDESGLPQPRANPSYWTRSWSRGSSVVYAQSYWASGGPTGGRTGSVYATAGELGVEITNTLRFTD